MSGVTAIVDTDVFVSARNPEEPGYAACRELLDRIDRGGLRAIVSTVTIAELRAGMSPGEDGPGWRAVLTHLLTTPSYRVEPVDLEVAEAAGALRASSRLTLPDAVIVATGLVRGASYVVTQDDKIIRRQTLLRVCRPGDIP